MNNESAQSFVTQAVFVEEMREVRQSVQKLDKRMGGLEMRVGGLDERADGLDKKVDSLDKKVGVLDKKVGVLDKKVDVLDKKVDDLTTSVERQAISLLKTQRDVEIIKETMVTKDEFRAMSAQIDGLAKIVKTADQNEKILLNHLRKELRPRVDDHERRLVALERRPPAP